MAQTFKQMYSTVCGSISVFVGGNGNAQCPRGFFFCFFGGGEKWAGPINREGVSFRSSSKAEGGIFQLKGGPKGRKRL